MLAMINHSKLRCSTKRRVWPRAMVHCFWTDWGMHRQHRENCFDIISGQQSGGISRISEAWSGRLVALAVVGVSMHSAWSMNEQSDSSMEFGVIHNAGLACNSMGGAYTCDSNRAMVTKTTKWYRKQTWSVFVSVFIFSSGAIFCRRQDRAMYVMR